MDQSPPYVGILQSPSQEYLQPIWGLFVMPDVIWLWNLSNCVPRRFLPFWSFRHETTGLFPRAHRSAPGPELQKYACAHIDSTDIMAVWQDRAFTSTPKHKWHSHGEKGHKQPNPVPPYQVKRLEIC